MFKNALAADKRRLLLLSVAGSAFEFFEFAIYSLFALNITKHLMPAYLHQESLIVWYLVSYGLFFIGYIARPIGGTLFGLISDKVSRKKSFISTMILMSFATIMIGLIPDYSVLGFMAPLLLLFLRLFQGIALGGELPSSTVLLYEHAKTKEKIFIVMWFMGLTNVGWLGGYLLDALLNTIFNAQQMDLYGWRLIFIIGGILALATAMLRKKLIDADVFRRYMALMHDPARGLMSSILKHYKSSLLAGIMLETLHGACVFLVAVLLKNILMHFYGFTAIKATHIQIFVIFAWMVFGVLAPFWVSKMNKLAVIPVATFGCCFSLFLVLVPAWHGQLIFFILLTVLFLAMIDGFAPYLVTRLFPMHLRATGLGVSYNIGTALGGILIVFFTAHAIARNEPFTLALSVLATLLLIYLLFLIAAFISKRFEALKIPM